MDEDFLLENNFSKKLYFDYAASQPIIDYHCHLDPADIANDRQFENLTKIWLEGDHYKWRALRANGIDEQYCTGGASDWDKFEKWAETVPFTVRNPLYHWTHMELRNPFGINEVLNQKSAKSVYNAANEMLQSKEFSVQGILKKMNVEVICTTDDPISTLDYHKSIKSDDIGIGVYPTFRADHVLSIDSSQKFLDYIVLLEESSHSSIKKYDDLINALSNRHDYFHENGCRLSDHGLEQLYALDYSHIEIQTIFEKGLNKQELSSNEVEKYRSAVLYELAVMDHTKGWTQQFHLGAIRNNNTKQLKAIGPDSGFDSIGEFSQARPLSRFLDKLDQNDKLTKTILYNLNPSQNEMMATMGANYNDGITAGKMQFGAAWWFLDQKDGIEKQLNALSNMSLLSRSVGMLTDSRSFLSYPRHDYFRRILCNLIGRDIENGELPASELAWLGEMVSNICYQNARNYFGFEKYQ